MNPSVLYRIFWLQVFLLLHGYASNGSLVNRKTSDSSMYSGNMKRTGNNNTQTLTRKTARNVKNAKNLKNRASQVVQTDPFQPDFPCVKRHSVGKIVGGKTVPMFSMPWMVFLKVSRSYNVHVICAATLISYQWILTAAHCLKRISTHGHSYVVLGVHNIDHCDEEQAVVLRIEKNYLYVHPGFEYSTMKNDIALVKLPRAIGVHPHIRPLCLPTKASSGNPRVGEVCVSAGWGKLNHEDRFPSPTLQSLRVEIKQCFNINTMSVICVGTPESVKIPQDSCSGDSGGPLLCNVNGSEMVVGVLSAGSFNCDAKWLTAVYTKVYEYLGWMKTVMNSKT